MAQLVEQLLPDPEVCGSNPVIGTKFILSIFVYSKYEKRKKEAGNGPFKKIAERAHFSTILPLIFISNYSDCEC